YFLLRACALQNLDHLRLAVLLREGERRAPVLVLGAHVRAVFEEEADGVGAPAAGGGDERGVPFRRARVHVRAAREERVERGDAAVGGGDDDGRHAQVVAPVHVRALLDQRVDQLVVALARGGEEQGRAAVVAARLHVRALLDEHPHYRQVSLKLLLARPPLRLSGEGDLLRGGLHVNAPGEQLAHDGELTAGRGEDEGGAPVRRLGVHVRAVVYEGLRRLGVAGLGRDHERRHAVRAARVGVRALRDQLPRGGL